MNEISIQKNISINREGEQEVRYEFESCVIHAGTAANFGHYYCVKQRNDKVTIFNDSMVSEFAFKPTDDDQCYLNTLQ